MNVGPIHPLDSRRAYYVFLTHLIKAHSSGLRWPVNTLAEFGTGTHLGIAFCALLFGSERYLGFDATPLLNKNLPDQINLLNEIHDLIQKQTPPQNDTGDKAFDFPYYIFSDEILDKATSAQRLLDLSVDLQLFWRTGISEMFFYEAPYDFLKLENFSNSVDMIISTATLEHVENIESIYNIFHYILRDGAIMSHSIDFRSHGFGRKRNGKRLWNEHWLESQADWSKLIEGKIYSINRLTCSQHLALMIKAHFDIILINKRIEKSELIWRDLAHEFQWMTSEDISCSGAHIVASKY